MSEQVFIYGEELMEEFLSRIFENGYSVFQSSPRRKRYLGFVDYLPMIVDFGDDYVTVERAAPTKKYKVGLVEMNDEVLKRVFKDDSFEGKESKIYPYNGVLNVKLLGYDHNSVFLWFKPKSGKEVAV